MSLERATDLIAKWEGFSAKAYQDIVGVWTIGYGTTRYPDGTPVKEGDTITKERAKELLHLGVVERAEKLQARLPDGVDLSDGEMSALVSLAYNVGVGNVTRSKSWKQLVAGNTHGFARGAFHPWHGFVKAGGKTVKGLQNRRFDECIVWFS